MGSAGLASLLLCLAKLKLTPTIFLDGLLARRADVPSIENDGCNVRRKDNDSVETPVKRRYRDSIDASARYVCFILRAINYAADERKARRIDAG